MTQKETAVDTDATKAEEAEQARRITAVIDEMTPKNWFLVRRALEMTKEEIARDSDCLLVLILWWESEEHTMQNLNALLETSGLELNAMFNGKTVEEMRAENAKAIADATESDAA